MKKRYFVSYIHQNAKDYGYGNTIIATEKFNKKEVEKHIRETYKHDVCIILNFQKLAQDES